MEAENAPNAPDSLQEQEKRLDCLFRHARTPLYWTDRPIDEAVIQNLYDVVCLGPTSGNCSPARFVFITSQNARERIRSALSAGNVARVMAAPLIVIVAYDPLFFEQLPFLCPSENLRPWFAADVGLSEETAFRNGTLQGGYMIMAARAMGLDVLPISGFDQATIEDAFLAAEGWRANFLLCLGYAEHRNLPPRAPRLSFSQACRVVS
ncbi:MAG: malonic semialdehyde reductase [Acetobacter sp.]|nr:malonic semialdehyde reductase [Acetobacter sp.]